MGLIKRVSKRKYLPVALKRVRAELPDAFTSTGSQVSEPERDKMSPFVIHRGRSKLSPLVIHRVRAELLVPPIVVFEQKTVDEFTRNDFMTATSAQDVAPCSSREDETFDSDSNRQAAGWNRIWCYLGCSPLPQVANRTDVISETETTAKDVASFPFRKGKTVEPAFNKREPGLERRRSFSGLISKISNEGEWSGKLNRSCGSSWSSGSSSSLDDDDDEESGESSQTSSSRIDKVLHLSAMSNTVSDIPSLLESVYDDSDYDSDADSLSSGLIENE
jgi:hypothetical protein